MPLALVVESLSSGQMAFTEEQLGSIGREVHAFCERRVPEQHRDQLCLVYSIEAQNVIIRESRPDWNEARKWIEMAWRS